MQALELTGFLDEKEVLKINKPINIINQKVKVMHLIPEQEAIEDQVWLKAMSNNPAFDFLHDEAEDIYSIMDGE